MTRAMRISMLVAIAVVLAVTPVFAGQRDWNGDAKAPAANGASGVYIVQMLQPPVVAYDGNIPGYETYFYQAQKKGA